MTFGRLAGYLRKLSQTTSRNTITQVLAELFGHSDKGEIDKICYLVSGRIAPSYSGIEFNFAEKMMIRAIAQAYGGDVKGVVLMYKRSGDLGDVAYELGGRGKSPEANLAKGGGEGGRIGVIDVYEQLKKLANEGGEGSQERKLAMVVELLQKVDPLSAKYIVRIPVGKLRLGFSDMTILDALSVMEVGDKSFRPKIEAAYNVIADIGKIAMVVKSKGLKGIGDVKAEPGIPIRASLAERLESAEKIIEKVGPRVAVEPKFDGLRLAIHVWNKGKDREVRLFSRNQENVTRMFPEIVETGVALGVKSAIFDGEAIGYNLKTGKFYPFQKTVQRKRKHGISEAVKNIPLKVFVFDILYLDGEPLLDKPFSERREVLEKILGRAKGNIVLAEQKIVDNAADFRKIANIYLGDGLEGAMAKKLDVSYRAGGRGFHWVKFKKHTEGGLTDTIDCVLMGAYRGRGRRAQFGVGGFLLGLVGKDGRVYSVSKLGTGLSDEQFRKMYRIVKELEVKEKPSFYVVDKLIEPDVWVGTGVVLEILADEITLSPRHTVGRDKEEGRGYSLRFPRLVRVREDKGLEDATSVEEVKRLYSMQSGGRK